MTIGVMLTAYKRTHLLERQIEAIRAQTVKADKVMLFDNTSIADPLVFSDHIWEHVDVRIAASRNLGVWPRFMLAPLLGTDYIAVFDDDTIPGPRWFANCLETLGELERQGVDGALLGANGLAFIKGNREYRVDAGWRRPEGVATQVDIVGHAWFFHRSLLGHYAPGQLAAAFPTCGDDYWLSFTAQQIGWPAVCPPHPPNKKVWWGSVDGDTLGSDADALWKQPEQEIAKNEFHDMMAKGGMAFNACRVEGREVHLTQWKMRHTQ